MLLKRPLRTRFRYGFPTRVNLATHRKLAGSFFKRHAVTRMCKHIPTLPRLVGTRFQVLFHSPPGVLFTIPSRYYPLSVTREYLGLAGGPARFTQDFSGPVLLGNMSRRDRHFVYGGLTLYAGPFACPSTTTILGNSSTGRQTRTDSPTTPIAQPLPGITRHRFSLIR